MHKIPPEELLIGAHTSISGGLYKSLLEGEEIGATTVQIFTSNQRQWKSKRISEDEAELFKATQSRTGLRSIMSHAGYLINLGSPNPSTLKKSREAIVEEIERCLALDLTFLVFHPGSALDSPREVCLEKIVESLLLLENLFIDDSLHLLIETTAGQGSSVGSSFEEIATLIQGVAKKIPIGVCIDTCHIFAAGYDIRTEQGWRKTLKEFDSIVGLQYLYAFHLNDSVGSLGSHKDRHANLGEGEIGIDSFKFLMREPRIREIPKYLETPIGTAIWDKEIWMLREFAK